MTEPNTCPLCDADITRTKTTFCKSEICRFHRKRLGIEECGRCDLMVAEIARLTQERDALAVALAQLREACLEDIGGRHEEIQCAICLYYWPLAGPPQHDATCILAGRPERQPRERQPRDQPAVAGAELLAAADDLKHWLQIWVDDTPGGPWCYSEAAIARYARARAGALPQPRETDDDDNYDAELVAAADSLADLLQRLSDSWPAGTWQEAAARIADYRRARAGHQAVGPGREGE